MFIDMATSAVAKGKIVVARARGQQVPLGWIVDKDGRPTTDPNDYFNGGVQLPLGGAEAHKGYALSVAVETLAALLPGLGFGVDPQGRHNDGVFILVVDPGTIRSSGDFKSDVADFARFLKDTPTAEGFSEVLYPGELEYRTEQRRRKEGIPIEESTWKAVGRVAERFGLSDLMRTKQ